jgi:O-methyltransferase involved in polyketide biosynthesis
VIPYLTSVEVSATLRALAGRSAPTSRLIVNYQAPSITAAAGRLFARAMSLLTSQRDMLWHEPWRSAWRPDEMGRLLSGAGFQPIRDVDLLTVSEGLGLEIQQSRSVSFGRVCVADQ